MGVPLPQMEHLYGKTHLEEELLDLTFQLSPSSYFQVNTKGAEVLYSTIIDLVEPTEDTTVLDLCCGTGGIGLCIAKVNSETYLDQTYCAQQSCICTFTILIYIYLLDILTNITTFLYGCEVSFLTLCFKMKYSEKYYLDLRYQRICNFVIYAGQ